jgi:acetyl esterase/lipase
MSIFRKVLKWTGILLLFVVIGASVTALMWGRPPAQRPDLVTPLPEGVPAPPHGYPSEATAFAAAFLFHDFIAYENGPPADGIVERYDIEYGNADGTSLKLDLYSPENLSAPTPGLVLFYGGGWRQGRKDQLREYAQYFAQHGYVVATPQYRLKTEGQWPKSIQDAKCAVRWMRAHAVENKVDPDRIGVMGNSAGAYLALMVGYTPGIDRFEGDSGWSEESSAAQAVVDIYGPVDFTEPERRDHDLVVKYMNGFYEDNVERFEAASPIRYVDEDSPPTCVIHGTVDMLVPVHQSDWLVEALQEHNVPHLYSRIDGWPHAMDIARDVNEHTRALILHFFDEHLRGEEATLATAS